MKTIFFIGGPRHGHSVAFSDKEVIPPTYAVEDNSRYTLQKCDYVASHPTTGRPQWRYAVHVYTHELVLSISDGSREQTSYQLFGDALLRRYFVEHGERSPVSDRLRPAPDARMGNGAAVKPHEDVWLVKCVDADCATAEEFPTGRQAAEFVHVHHAQTGHVLSVVTPPVEV